ncbi:hypothetical protein [Nonomuraea indica]|uniref:Uncharacterized protein n=1 Tax=Nonomuraea indica TaxID=1581193 RepID=A0ABW7ZW60_9ACTN
MVRLIVTLLAVALVLGGDRFVVWPLVFARQSAQAALTWRASGAAEIWSKGFVPVEELTAMPPEVLAQIRQDDEYGWVVAGPLPAAPAEAQVRWDDGSTMRVPVIGAREALRELSPWPENYTFPDDEAYHLTGAAFTTMRLRTVRGMAEVPAWRLRFSNLPGPIDHVAVDREKLGTVADAVGDHPGSGVSDFTVIDDRTLLVRYGYGSCGGRPRVLVGEHPDVVVLGLRFSAGGGNGICLAVGLSGHDVVRLDTPLGDRVVLDAATRLPVLCGHMADACRSGDG